MANAIRTGRLDCFCVDVGAIQIQNSKKENRFGWYCSDCLNLVNDAANGASSAFKDIEELVKRLSNTLERGRKVALGFECPLFIPVREDPRKFTRKREEDEQTAWSAGPAATVLVTGMAEISWTLDNLFKQLKGNVPAVFFSFEDFLRHEAPAIFFWEALVSGKGKEVETSCKNSNEDQEKTHVQDACRGVEAFLRKLDDFKKGRKTPLKAGKGKSEKCLNMLGACLLWAGYAVDRKVLGKRPVVISATPEKSGR